jgi:hypothetical protein
MIVLVTTDRRGVQRGLFQAQLPLAVEQRVEPCRGVVGATGAGDDEFIPVFSRRTAKYTHGYSDSVQRGR